MNKTSLLTSTAFGAALGATVFGAGPAFAQMAVIDWASIAVSQAIKALETTISSTLTSITGQLSSTGPLATLLGANTFGDINTLLRQGFTQNANYSKAQISASTQIADASNLAHARLARDIRNAQIRDEHTANPIHCAALDNGQLTTVASGQSWKVAKAIQQVQDKRGEAVKGMPSYYGQGQAVQANAQFHLARYCSEEEAADGLCGVSALPNADQQVGSLFGTGTYKDQDGIDAANAYIVNLVQPIPPAALRGSQLSSISGQEASARRRAYEARMSLARSVLNDALASQTPSVALTAEQKQQMQNEGLTPIDNGSWLQAITLDANRRYSSVNWAAQLQTMPPAAVNREIAVELAQTNYLLLQLYHVSLRGAAIEATHLAATAEHNFPPAAEMPSPTIANQ